MSKRVSVLIPVYNTSKYLDECMETVVNQTHKDMEIILLDDESTDNSGAMCDEWAAKDDRIKVVHKKNEGLGLTRNVGLDMISGDYVSFLDSDDSLDLNAFEICINTLEEKDADACFFGRRTFDDKGNYSVNKDIPDKLEYTGDEVRTEFACRYFGLFPYEERDPYIKESVTRAFYRRSVIEATHIRFHSERECASEDVFFNLEVCRNANRIIIIPKELYNYRHNPDSLTRKYDPKRVEKCRGFYRLLLEYEQKYTEIPDVRERLNYNSLAMLRGVIKKEAAHSTISEAGKTIKRFRDIVNDPDFIRMNEEYSHSPNVEPKTKRYLKWFLGKRVHTLFWFYHIKGRTIG